MSWKAGLSRNVRELRFLYSQETTDPVSAGIRAFVQNQYAELALLNPLLPLRVRQGPEVKTATVVARYDYGDREVVDVSHGSEEDVTQAIKSLHEKGTDKRRSPDSCPLPPDII